MTFRAPVRAAGLASALRSFVRREYRNVEAVRALSFAVEPGEVVGFIGPNGAGKTTMMDVVTGKTRPDSGEAFFRGTADLSRLDEAAIANLGIGRKFQKPTVFEPQTVWDNLLLALAGDRGTRFMMFARETAEEKRRIEAILETTRLKDQRYRRGADLSLASVSTRREHESPPLQVTPPG